MNKTIKILAVVAAIQVLFIVAGWQGDSELEHTTNKTPLISINTNELDSIEITGSDDEIVVLRKQENLWVTGNNFPADQNKVTALLDKLGSIKTGLPVATSAGALTRFKVADDAFERHLVLKQGDKTVGDLYLGTGAGARQTHARNSEQTAVYTVALGTYDAPASTDEWQDRAALNIDNQKVSSFTFDGLTLTREKTEGDKAKTPTLWSMDTLPENKVLDHKGINNALSPLLSIRFSKVLGSDNSDDYGLGNPVLQLSVDHGGNAGSLSTREYRFGKIKQNNSKKDEIENSSDDKKSDNDSGNYVLKVSDRDEYFEIAEYAMKPLLEGFDKESWLIDVVEPEPKAEENLSPESISDKSGN